MKVRITRPSRQGGTDVVCSFESDVLPQVGDEVAFKDGTRYEVKRVVWVINSKNEAHVEVFTSW
jgi:hypothetical protein